jgi:hypothetical protein
MRLTHDLVTELLRHHVLQQPVAGLVKVDG